MKRWRTLFPILRCPYCRHPLVMTGDARYTLRGPTKKELEEAGVSPASGKP